jgi:hypothetical protein
LIIWSIYDIQLLNTFLYLKWVSIVAITKHNVIDRRSISCIS